MAIGRRAIVHPPDNTLDLWLQTRRPPNQPSESQPPMLEELPQKPSMSIAGGLVRRMGMGV
jgi:hypothetical protein